jgi:hypothetical protein
MRCGSLPCLPGMGGNSVGAAERVVSYRQPDRQAGTAAGSSPGGDQDRDERALSRWHGAQPVRPAQLPRGRREPQFRYPPRQQYGQPPARDWYGQPPARDWYGQPPARDSYGQPDPGHGQGQPSWQDQAYQGQANLGQPSHPPRQPYGQQPRQPPFTPDPRYGMPPQPTYPGQPQHPPQPYGMDPGHQAQPFGQQPYEAQPYGPPDQPPHHDPGPEYDPQPRRRRWKHHLVHSVLVLAGIGIVVVGGIVISRLASRGTGVSTTTSGDTSSLGSASAPAVTPIRVDSYFDVSDISGDTYRVTLVKIIDPAQGADQFNAPDGGSRFVGAVFEIKVLKGSLQDENANNNAAVIGSNGQTYHADFDAIGGYTNFSNGSITVAHGDTTTGAVTFQVPNGITVTELQWTGASGYGSTVQWHVRS